MMAATAGGISELLDVMTELFREAECGWAYAPEADRHAAIARIDAFKSRAAHAALAIARAEMTAALTAAVKGGGS